MNTMFIKDLELPMLNDPTLDVAPLEEVRSFAG
jgi:hypothetical protein